MPLAGSSLSNTALLALPIAAYKDRLVTPAALSLRGISVRTLAATYGMRALIDFGLTWHHMVGMGLQAEDLAAFSADQLRCLRVDARLLLDVRPSAAHIVNMGLSAREFEQMGCASIDWLLAVQHNMHSMQKHGFSLTQWSTMLGAHTDWARLGFTDMAVCQAAGWDKDELYKIIFSNKHAQLNLSLK